MILAEDHKIVAEALRVLLAEHFQLLAVVHDGRALVEATERLLPDVIVTDISMPLLNGLGGDQAIDAAASANEGGRVHRMHKDRALAGNDFALGCADTF